jgi:hypothetical protein
MYPSCNRLTGLLVIYLIACPGVIFAEEEEDWTPPNLELKVCGTNDWPGRVGVFLGSQYFGRSNDKMQFNFGAEGNLRLVGPLSAGLAFNAGFISETTLTAQAGLRLDLVRSCVLSLALDVRSGATFWLPGDNQGVEPIVSGGLELVHDLGETFYIQLRVSSGYLFKEEWGWFIDFVLGLGLFL